MNYAKKNMATDEVKREVREYARKMRDYMENKFRNKTGES